MCWLKIYLNTLNETKEKEKDDAVGSSSFPLNKTDFKQIELFYKPKKPLNEVSVVSNPQCCSKAFEADEGKKESRPHYTGDLAKTIKNGK